MKPIVYLSGGTPAPDEAVCCEFCKCWERLPADEHRGQCAQHSGDQTGYDGPSACQNITPADAWCVHIALTRAGEAEAWAMLHGDDDEPVRYPHDPFAARPRPGDAVEFHGRR
jgi:hypothetical protein